MRSISKSAIPVLIVLIGSCGLFRKTYRIEEVTLDMGAAIPTVKKNGEPISSGRIKAPDQLLGETSYKVKDGKLEWRKTEISYKDLTLKKEWNEKGNETTLNKGDQVLFRRVEENGAFKRIDQYFEDGTPYLKRFPADTGDMDTLGPDDENPWIPSYMDALYHDSISAGKKARYKKYVPVTKANRKIIVFGVVKNGEQNKAPLGNALIILSDRDGNRTIALSDEKGRYKLHLDYGKLYRVQYRVPDWTVKTLQFDTKGISKEDRALGNFQMETDVTLHKNVAQQVKDYLRDTVMGKASYNKERGSIDWNSSHTQRIKKKVEALKEE